jgi:hypothetical protein
MAVTIEKRTVKLPSCLVDKKLIQELGELIEADSNLQNRLSYLLDSKTKDIRCVKVQDFITTDWGSNLNRVVIETADNDYPKVKIEINFRQIKFSEYSIVGKDATWVNGIRTRVDDVFSRYKDSYHQIQKPIFLKIPLTILITLSWAVPIFLWTQSLQVGFPTASTFLALIGGYGALIIFLLVDWLLPKFEYEGMKQKQVRKWIAAVLIGSGIIPTLLLKLIGL